MAIRSDPIVHDLTDESGHGVVVGTDNLYMFMSSRYCVGNVADPGMTGIARILYRFKEVGLAEYIGIVQSQSQQPS